MSLRRVAVTASLLVGVLVASALPASAAVDRQHITITPSSAELSIAPGQSESGDLSVINQGTDSFKIALATSPYHVQGIQYDPQFTQLPGTVDASKWVQLTVPSNTSLAPNDLIHIKYSVSIPSGTQPGGYYAVIFAESSPIGTTHGVVTHNRVGEILYITVKGKVNTSGKVLPVDMPFIDVNGSLPISLRVQNTGGLHFKTTYTATVTGIFGNRVFTQKDERYVLPQTERQITVNWTNNVPIGIYRVSRQATGPQGVMKLPDTWVIMVQPWVLLVLIVLIAAFIVGLMRRSQRYRKRK
jgi:hypothetical protein